MLYNQFYYIIEFEKPLVVLERCDAEQWAELLGELILLEELWRTCAFGTAPCTNPRWRSDLERHSFNFKTRRSGRLVGLGRCRVARRRY